MIATQNPKIFNCPIHGHIELSPLSVRIIDTPQFQRLRDISQLGGVYFVFPGAASKRFEHCIGVSHLARSFCEFLRSNQPELNITTADVLCVEIAGLLHDLGHGPFSHLFDARVFKQLLPPSHKFAHEHASIGIIDILIEENNLMPEFAKYGMDRNDIHFIKELILGDLHDAPPGFEWKGRGDKTFLYDIVANKRNGIDVDKFDYFARDCHVLGVTKSFDASRLMRFARVFRVKRDKQGKVREPNSSLGSKRPISSIIEDEANLSHSNKPFMRGTSAAHMSSTSSTAMHQFVTQKSSSLDTFTPVEVTTTTTTQASMDNEEDEGKLEICFHVKEVWNLTELFHTRYALHKRAYQHKVAIACELMVTEGFLKASPFIRVKGFGGQLRTIAECASDFHAYWRLGEYMFRDIEHSWTPELQPAREIIERLRKRDLFPQAAELILKPEEVDLIRGGAASLKNALLQINKKRMLKSIPADPHVSSSSSSASLASSQSPGSQSTLEESPAHGKKAKDKEFIPSGGYLDASAAASDIFCCVIKLDYGKGGKDPVSEMTTFFRPIKSDDASSHPGSVDYEVGPPVLEAVTRLVPKEYQEVQLRVYCRYKHQKAVVASLVEEWSHRKSDTLTPLKRCKTL